MRHILQSLLTQAKPVAQYKLLNVTYAFLICYLMSTLVKFAEIVTSLWAYFYRLSTIISLSLNHLTQTNDRQKSVSTAHLIPYLLFRFTSRVRL